MAGDNLSEDMAVAIERSTGCVILAHFPAASGKQQELLANMLPPLPKV